MLMYTLQDVGSLKTGTSKQGQQVQNMPKCSLAGLAGNSNQHPPQLLNPNPLGLGR